MSTDTHYLSIRNTQPDISCLNMDVELVFHVSEKDTIAGWIMFRNDVGATFSNNSRTPMPATNTMSMVCINFKYGLGMARLLEYAYT